jgi:recombination associated protein RdgC
MWFKNLQIYRLPAPWAKTAEALAQALAPHAFTPCTSADMLQQGWVAPRPDGDLVHAVAGQFLLMLKTEKKLLPPAVINQVAAARAIELEEAQGFAPGKKAMKELKERVADELLPRAFSLASTTAVWIDPINGWLVVDAASPAKADEVIKLLLKAIDKFPLESLRVQRSPTAVMTEWLQANDAPAGFTVDMDTELRATGESRAQISYKRHTLEPDDVRRHIAAGKQCTKLAMTWNDRISFVLDESLAIKSVKALDVLVNRDHGTANDEERFDGDMMLMTGELSHMLADVVEALGGEAAVDGAPKAAEPRAADSADAGSVTVTYGKETVVLDAAARERIDKVLAAPESADLYDQAVAIVLAQRRASISLVQRHLRIGYNHAARLIEEMEVKGVISPMASNGAREVLTQSGAGGAA